MVSHRNKFVRAVRVSASCVARIEEALNRDLQDQLWWIEQALDEFGEMGLAALEDEFEDLILVLNANKRSDPDLEDIIDSIYAVIVIKECQHENRGLSGFLRNLL